MPAQPNLITFRRFWVNRLPTCEIRWTHSRGNFKTNKLFNTPTTSVLLKGICFLKIFTGSIASSPPKFLLMACSISGQRGSRPCSSAVLYTIFTKLKLNVRIEWFNRRLFYLNINVLILARDNLNIFNPFQFRISYATTMIRDKISKEFENCQTEKKIKFLTNNHYMKERGHSCKLQCTQVLFRNKAKCKSLPGKWVNFCEKDFALALGFKRGWHLG